MYYMFYLLINGLYQIFLIVQTDLLPCIYIIIEYKQLAKNQRTLYTCNIIPPCLSSLEK